MSNFKKRLLPLLFCFLLTFSYLKTVSWDSALLYANAADNPPYCGIDVSAHNGNINWSTAKARGVDFAVIRCYCLKKDAYFDQNYNSAKANGIAVGAYIYMYAENADEARYEAQGTLNALGGKNLDLPLFLDVEDSLVTALGKSSLTDLMLIELEMFEAAGYKVGIYTSQSYISSYMDASRLTGYYWWVARWTCVEPQTFTFQSESPSSNKKPSCDMWQFSDGGDGNYYGMSSTYVDLDFCYADFLNGNPRPNSFWPFTSTYVEDITTDSATIRATIAGQSIQKAGFYIMNGDNTWGDVYTENVNAYTENIWYPLKSECGYTLSPGTTYCYSFFVRIDGREYVSDTKSFTTPKDSSVFTSVYAADMTEDNAHLYATTDLIYVSSLGFYLGNSPDNLTKVWSENPSTNDGSLRTIDNDLKNECHLVLMHATTYYYRYYLVRKSDGAEIQSGINSFKTAGTHEYSYSTVTKPASCLESGFRTLTCACGAEMTEVIPPTDHTPSEWIVTNEPTYSSEGTKIIECVNCHTPLETELIPPLEQEYATGDINGDGIVNNKDLTRLMKYLAGEDVVVVTQVTDVNGDGIINVKDLTRLMKKLAE